MNNYDIYRKIIISNSIKPNNFIKITPKNYKIISITSNTCFEFYDIFIKLKNNKIIDIKFKGKGCSISKAAINIISNTIKNKDKKEAINLIFNYINMINKKEFDKNKVGDLIIFKNISIHFNRINCALIGANKIMKFLKTNFL